MNDIFFSEHQELPLSAHCHIITTKGIYNIPLADILFIECSQKKSLVHFRKKILSLPIPLYRFKEVLPASVFLQTHRSYLVNRKNISYIDKQKDPWTISFFHSSEHAFISRSFRHQIIESVQD